MTTLFALLSTGDGNFPMDSVANTVSLLRLYSALDFPRRTLYSYIDIAVNDVIINFFSVFILDLPSYFLLFPDRLMTSVV